MSRRNRSGPKRRGREIVSLVAYTCEALESRRLLSATLALFGPQTITPGATANVSSDAGNFQSEMQLVVNPTNPLNLVGFSTRVNATITLDVYSSTDGGSTWAINQINNTDDGFGIAGNRFDPAITFDANGTCYIVYGHREVNFGQNQTRLISGTSTDGGATFGNFQRIDLQPDRGTTPGLDKWYVASGTDPNSGNQAVYVAYVHFATEGSNNDDRIMVSGTNNGGNTWTAPLVINDAAINGADVNSTYACPVVGRNGELAVSWHDMGDTTIRLDRDLDGLWATASNFGTDIEVRTGVDVVRSSVLPPAQPERGINAAPMLAVSPSNALFMPVVQKFMGSNSDLDIWVGVSNTFGASWTFNRIDDSVGTEFNPWLAVDQASGTINVLYYTSEGDVANGNDDVRPRLATSNDAGATWTRAFLSNQTSNEGSGDPNGLGYSGDYLEYIGLAVRDGTAHGLWASRYPGGTTDLDAFTANASFVSSINDNRLVIGESGSANDSFLVRVSPTNNAYLEVFVDGVREYTGLANTVDKIIFNPGGGTNTFNIGTIPDISEVGINGTSDPDSIVIQSLGLNMPLSIALAGDNDVVTIADGAGFHAIRSPVAIDGGNGNDIVHLAPNSPFDSFVVDAPFTFNGGNNNDTLNIASGGLDAVSGLVTFNGDASDGGSGDRVVLNDGDSFASFDYNITPSAVTRQAYFGGLNYSTTERIVVNGSGGSNDVTISNGISPLLEIHGNDGDDNFIVGDGLVGAQSGRILTGDGDVDQITFDDHLSNTNTIWDLRENEVFYGGLIVLETNGFESVGVLAGNGADEFTTAGALTQNFTVDGGGGDDTALLDGGISGAISMNLGADNDEVELLPDLATADLFGAAPPIDLVSESITIGNSGDRYDFSTSALRVFAFFLKLDVTFSNVTTFTVNAGDVAANAINVAGTAAGTSLVINGNSNAETVSVVPHDATGNLIINGNINFVGGNGTDSLTINDTASNSLVNYVLSGTSVSGMGSGAVTASGGVETLTLNAGGGSDTFQMNSWQQTPALAVDGGGGADTFDVTPISKDIGLFINLSSFSFNGGDGSDYFNLHNDNSGSIGVGWKYTRTTNNLRAEYHIDFPGQDEEYVTNFGQSGVETLIVTAGSLQDQFFVYSTPSGFDTQLNGGGGNNDVTTVGNGLTQGILGRVNVGTETLVIDDTADTVGRTTHVDSFRVNDFAGDDMLGPGGYLTIAGVTSVTVRCGSGFDTVDSRLSIYGVVNLQLGPQPGPALESIGDQLNLALAGVGGYIIVGTAASGTVVPSNPLYHQLTYSGVQVRNIDDVAPQVLSAVFDQANQSIDVQFSEDVSQNLAASYLSLFNETTGQSFTDIYVIYDAATNTAHFRPNAPGNAFPAGTYQAMVTAAVSDEAGNPLGASDSNNGAGENYQFSFVAESVTENTYRLRRNEATGEYYLYITGSTTPDIVYPPSTTTITVSGGGGPDSFILDEAGYFGASYYVLTSPSGNSVEDIVFTTGGAPSVTIEVSNTIENLTINGSDGRDRVDINSFKTGQSLTINGGDDGDQVIFSADVADMAGRIIAMGEFHFVGGGGYDGFRVQNHNTHAAWDYTLAIGSFRAHTSGLDLTLNVDAESWNIWSGDNVDHWLVNSANQELTLGGYNGEHDVVTIGDGTTQNITNIVETETYSVIIDDSADTVARKFHANNYYVGQAAGDNLFGPGGFLHNIGIHGPVIIQTGTGNDTAYVRPTYFPYTVNAGGGNDTLNLALAGLGGYTFSGNIASGSVTPVSLYHSPVGWSNFDQQNIDDVAPQVTSASFAYSGSQSINFTFTEDVSASLSEYSLYVSGPVDSRYTWTYDPATNTVHWRLTAPNLLPDGHYRAYLQPFYVQDQFGNPLNAAESNYGDGAQYVFDFFVQPADANHDGYVNSLDFNVLAMHFNMVSEPGNVLTYEDGDFNLDGKVNALDFNALATNFGRTLSAPSASLALALPSTTKAPALASPRSAANLFSRVPVQANDAWAVATDNEAREDNLEML